MNIHCRRRAAFEGILGLRTRMPWLSTLVMPADGGTRPDARGQLSLADPQWFAADWPFPFLIAVMRWWNSGERVAV